MTVIRTDLSVDGALVAHLKFSRPERLNALGPTLAKEFLQNIQALHSPSTQELPIPLQKNLRAVIISADAVSKGNQRTWIAGGDLKELALLKDPSEAKSYAETMRLAIESLDGLPVPVIIYVDGTAIGGGAELAIAGDIRYATTESTLQWRQLNVGLPTGYGSTRRLSKLIGVSASQRLLYHRETLSAPAAVDMGLFHKLLPSIDSVMAEMKDILTIDPMAWAAQKKLFHQVLSGEDSNTADADMIFAEAWRNPTHAKNLQAYQGSPL